jgi:glycosyltransferase involved in cell wall biosynthesis
MVLVTVRLSGSSALLQLLRRRFFAAPSESRLVHNLDDADVLRTWRAILQRDRSTVKYHSVFSKDAPLVSVCITTADRATVLADRALTSIKQQTYGNLEVIIVGDRCDDNTDAVVAGFGDRRLKFFNLNTRGPYPRPGVNRWMVAGTNAANFALQRVTGDLVTHVDEDDTYVPHRIETLVRELQKNEADLVFHPFYWQNDNHSWTIRGNGVPGPEHTATGSILYHNWFAKVPWDVYAFRLGEPGDWNRLRKIEALGANLRYVDQILARHWKYPVREAFVAKPGETFLD